MSCCRRMRKAGSGPLWDLHLDHLLYIRREVHSHPTVSVGGGETSRNYGPSMDRCDGVSIISRSIGQCGNFCPAPSPPCPQHLPVQLNATEHYVHGSVGCAAFSSMHPVAHDRDKLPGQLVSSLTLGYFADRRRMEIKPARARSTAHQSTNSKPPMHVQSTLGP